MPWGRCDDGFYRHEKVAELDEGLRKGCIALFWLAISWCNDRLTDGRVPPGTLRILGADLAEAEELVRVGLWEKDGHGWVVHDFSHYNRTRAQVEQDRIQRVLAGKSGAQHRWHPDSALHGDSLSEMHGGPAGETDGGTDSGSPNEMDAPYPVPRSPVLPEPAPFAREGWPNLTTEAIAALERLTGRPWSRAGDKQLGELDRLIADHALDRVIAAMEFVGAGKQMTARQLVWPAMKHLEPFPDPKAIRLAEADATDRQERGKRLQRQREERYQTTGMWDAAWGEPPPRPTNGAVQQAASR